MVKKLFSRKQRVPAKEMQNLEMRLEAALQPVAPSPAFVAGLQSRLMHSFATQVVEPRPTYAFGSLWRASTRYGSAILALTGLRAWRGILVVLVFLLKGWSRKSETLHADQASSLA